MFCLKQISKLIHTTYVSAETMRFGKNKVTELIQKFIRTYNNKAQRYKVSLKLNQVKRVNKHNFLVTIKALKHGNIEGAVKSKETNEEISYFFAIFFSLDDKKIYFFQTKDKIKSFILSIFTSKTQLKLKEKLTEQLPKESFSKLLRLKKYKIYEMEFSYSNLGIGEAIKIKSKTGKCMAYYDKLKDDLLDSELSINNILYLKLAENKEKSLSISFKPRGLFKIMVCNQLRRKYLPEDFIRFIDESVLLYDELDIKSILRHIIYKGYFDQYDLKNSSIKDTIKFWKTKKFVKIVPVYRYKCTADCNFYEPIKKPVCECGAICSKKFIYNFEIRINFKEIEKKIGKLLKLAKTKYETLLPKQLDLYKKSTTFRLTVDDRYIYLYLNKNGMSKSELRRHKLLGIPMIVINFKGEMESNLSNFSKLSGDEFLSLLLTNNLQKYNELIESAKKSSFGLRNDSFIDACKEISNKKIDPITFEILIYRIFNILFLNTQKWGGPGVADGSFIFRSGSKYDYALWDAKRYTTVKLTEYVKQKSLIKDIAYLKKFSEDKLINNFGNVKFYIFVTFNTNKDDFLECKNILNTYILKSNLKKEVKKKLKICCIDRSELTKLIKYILKDPDNLYNNYNDINRIIKQSLRTNNGYFEFDDLKQKLKKIEKQKIFPALRELRIRNKNARTKTNKMVKK